MEALAHASHPLIEDNCPVPIPCLICTRIIDDPIGAIKPNPDSFQRFIKLLISPSPESFIGKQGGANYSFISSPLIYFCFTCHDKLIEVEEVYSKLQEVQAQLLLLTSEIQIQLQSVSNCNLANTVYQFKDFESLRNTVITELGLTISNDNDDATPTLSVQSFPQNAQELSNNTQPQILDAFTLNLGGIMPLAPVPVVKTTALSVPDPEIKSENIIENQEEEQQESMINNDLDFVDVYHDTDPLNPLESDNDDDDGDSDYVPNISGDEQGEDEEANSGNNTLTKDHTPSNPKLYNLSKTIRKCYVQLGKRIDQVIPICDKSSSPIVIPKELLDQPLPPWTKFRAITTAIYNGKFPKKCPIEGCMSSLSNRPNFRIHIVNVHLSKRFPNERIPVPEEDKKPAWKTPSKLKAELKSFEYPTKCPRFNCIETLFSHQRSLFDHFIECHYAEFKNKPKKTLSPKLQSFLQNCKTFPAHCPVENCTNKRTAHPKPYPTIQYLRHHMVTFHSENHHQQQSLSKTQKPGYSKPTKELLNQLNSIENFPVLCPIPNCPSKLELKTKRCLSTHLKIIHKLFWKIPRRSYRGAQRFHCTYPNCDKGFYVKKSLEEHILTHKEKNADEDAQEAKCMECNKAFSNRDRLEIHIKVTHVRGPKQPRVQCHLCGNNMRENSMISHMKRHTGEFNYACRVPGCGKGFLTASVLKGHERAKHWKELGLEPFRCNICGKFYDSGHNLKLHIQTHAGTMKFSCDQCNYKTQRKCDLKEHTASVHSLGYPWKCEECGKGFKLERQLKKHSIQHKSEDELATCEICNKAFNTKRFLRIHKERMHGINTGVSIGSVIEGI